MILPNVTVSTLTDMVGNEFDREWQDAGTPISVNQPFVSAMVRRAVIAACAEVHAVEGIRVALDETPCPCGYPELCSRKGNTHD